jgi:hypothetical protein
MAGDSEERYFVTIRTGTLEGLAEIRTMGLDLFGTTAKAGERVTIDGLLSLADIGRVVAQGYEVVVRQPAANRSRAHDQTSNAKDWLAEMGA